MDISEVLSKVDHTLLSVNATEKEIIKICDDAIKFSCASICIPPSYVRLVKDYVGDKIAVCTVIGFPNGYMTSAVKCFEAEDAVNNGADEIDMVINIGFLKDGKYDEIINEINDVKKACKGKLLKVIIETCLLTDAEKIKMCEIVSKSNADYIKTSTGFSTSGATFEDIRIFADNVSNGTKIKAAGGIATLDDAEKFIELGADRLGTSRIVKLLINQTDNLGY